jgi:hypothetical protein
VTYVVLAAVASMALNAPSGMAIGFVLALIVALARSEGTVRERMRQVTGVSHLRCMTAFAIVSLVGDELDDWKIVAITWFVAAFAIGAWRTHGQLAARDRWALSTRFAAAVAGVAMAWLHLNWVSTPTVVWWILVGVVTASTVKAAFRWPDLPWIEHADSMRRRRAGRAAGTVASLLMCAAIVGMSVV